MIGAAATIWAAGAAGVYAFYRREIDEDQPRSHTALFAAGWPVLLPLGLVWMGIDKLLDR